MNSNSPYLEKGRLAEVIQAIQVLGYYKFYKRNISDWIEQITGKKDFATLSHWRKVFEEHPEFFKIEEEQNVGLLLRRTFKKNYHVDSDKELSRAELDVMSFTDIANRVSRIPLAEQEIVMLVQTAIALHESAMRRKADRRWFLPLAIALLVGWLPPMVALFDSKEPIEVKLINEPIEEVNKSARDTITLRESLKNEPTPTKE